MDLRIWATEQRGLIPPKTPLGRALGYLYRQWDRLVLFLRDGRIELTNNRVERELRKLVLGRKNWLFTWEDLGGERTATMGANPLRVPLRGNSWVFSVRSSEFLM